MNSVLRWILRTPADGSRVFQYIKENAGRMAKAGTPLQVTVAKYKATRSNEQNKRWWGAIVTPVAEQVVVGGVHVEPEVWAHYLKEKCLPDVCAKGIDKHRIMPDGSRVLSMGSSDLNTHEFSEFMDRCEAFVVTEFGVFLPADVQ
jgi:hypothetical protein